MKEKIGLLFDRILEKNYINSNLLKEEKKIYETNLNKFIFAPALITFIFSLPLFLTGVQQLKLIGTLLLVYSIVMGIKFVFEYISTEIGVTNKRVIAKYGFISINTLELNLNKIESIQIEQSIIGKMFNFGTVKIIGTGGTPSIIRMVDFPLSLKKEVMKLIYKEEN